MGMDRDRDARAGAMVKRTSRDEQHEGEQWRRRTSRPRCKGSDEANLPAGLVREAGNRHAMDGATRARSHARGEAMVIARTVTTTCELDDQALTHELGAVYPSTNVSMRKHVMRKGCRRVVAALLPGLG